MDFDKKLGLTDERPPTDHVITKVGHLQPFYLCLSRLGCSLGDLQDVLPEKFCQAKHPEDKNLAFI